MMSRHPRARAIRRATIAALATLLLAGALGGAAVAQDDEPTTVRALLPAPRVLGLYPQLIPEVLGYYADEGLDVFWEPTDGSSFVVQQIAAGNADVGVAQTGPVLLGFEQSPNFRSFYDTNSNTRGHLNDLWVTSASGIASLADLPAGARIGIKDLAGGELPALRQRLARAGLTEDTDYTLIPLGEDPGVQAQALADGTVDAVYIVVFSLIPMRNALADAGHGITCVTCDPDQPITTQVVIVRDDFLAEHRDAVVGLCRAMAKATWFGQVDPDAAAAAMKVVNPEEQADPQDVADKMAQAAISFEPEPLPADRDHYGMQNMDGWQNAMDLIIDPSSPTGLSGPVDLTQLVDNSLIDECNDFDRDEVARQATEYQAAP